MSLYIICKSCDHEPIQHVRQRSLKYDHALDWLLRQTVRLRGQMKNSDVKRWYTDDRFHITLSLTVQTLMFM